MRTGIEGRMRPRLSCLAVLLSALGLSSCVDDAASDEAYVMVSLASHMETLGYTIDVSVYRNGPSGRLLFNVPNTDFSAGTVTLPIGFTGGRVFGHAVLKDPANIIVAQAVASEILTATNQILELSFVSGNGPDTPPLVGGVSSVSSGTNEPPYAEIVTNNPTTLPPAGGLINYTFIAVDPWPVPASDVWYNWSGYGTGGTGALSSQGLVPSGLVKTLPINYTAAAGPYPQSFTTDVYLVDSQAGDANRVRIVAVYAGINANLTVSVAFDPLVDYYANVTGRVALQKGTGGFFNILRDTDADGFYIDGSPISENGIFAGFTLSPTGKNVTYWFDGDGNGSFADAVDVASTWDTNNGSFVSRVTAPGFSVLN